MIIYKTTTFDAAHRLKGHTHCGMIHGHTWKVEVWIEGVYHTGLDLGMLFDFREINAIVQSFDHRCILAWDDLENAPQGGIVELPYAPSCENLVDYFLKVLRTNLNQNRIAWISIRCRIWESDSSYAEDVIYGEKEKE